jgi:hypothetical protein
MKFKQHVRVTQLSIAWSERPNKRGDLRGITSASSKTKENRELVTQGLKRCCVCKEIKLLAAFYPMRTGQFLGGVQNICKPCASQEARHSFTKRLYGITAQQYQDMFAAQESSCAICGEPGKSPDTLVRSGRRGPSGVLVVDHDHTSGKVRGLLCNSCNNGLGSFKDDPNLLQEATAYLLLHSTS